VPSALAAIGQTSSAAALTVWNAVAREMAPDCFFRGFSLLANNLFLFCPLVGARKGNPLYNAPALTYHSAALPRPPSIRNLNATRFRVVLSSSRSKVPRMAFTLIVFLLISRGGKTG